MTARRMRRANGATIALVAIITSLIVASVQRTPAQAAYTLRPSLPPSGTTGGFANVQNAYDTSSLTASSITKGVACHVNCMFPQVVTTTWSGFTGGYTPTQLTVRWSASSVFQLYRPGAAGYVEGKIEYSTNGGGAWQILELWSDVAPNSSLVTHDISVTLPTNTETANVQVRATLTVQMTACESCGGLYVSNVTGAMSVWDIRLDADGCLVPDSEYSYTSNWNAGIPTAHDFGAAISNSQGTNFARRTVEERDPGGGGPDSCYWDGSLLDPQTTISGGAWPVGTSNQYGYDTVGWPPSAVEYIRENRRDPLPCETQFPQQMVINCGASTTAYRTNTLRMGIDTNTVFSERDGVYISRSWP